MVASSVSLHYIQLLCQIRTIGAKMVVLTTGLFAGSMNLHCVPTGPNRSRVTYEMFSTNENKFTK